MTDPLISIWLRNHQRPYVPGDELHCEYQIDAVDPAEFQAVEASILWCTEGKGDEDIAVHYFERCTPSDFEGHDVRSMRRFVSVLPNSPMSYDGRIVKIRWLVRVRLFLRKGREFTDEHPFVLGPLCPRSDA